jgi:hypothetical protein
MAFVKWLNALDKAFLSRFMVSIHDLPDYNLESYFEDGFTVQEALEDIAESAGMSDEDDE